MGSLIGGILLVFVGIAATFVGRSRVKRLRTASEFRPSGIADDVARISQVGGLVVVVLGALLIFSSFVRIVPANTVGIPTTFGKIGSPFASGFHITAPWTEITEFSTRTQELSMLQASDEGDMGKDDSITVIARGGGSMKVDVTVRFSLAQDMASELFKQAGSLDLVKDRFVRPDTREVVRDVFGKYSAEEGYSTLRGQIATEITDDLRSRLLTRGIVVDTVNVRDVSPEQQVLDSINAVLRTRNEAAQALEDQKKKVIEAETRKQVATLDKEATVTKAEADAQAVSIAAEAQAKANQAIAASLTPELVELEIAKACADAIAATQAQVINVCANQSGGTAGAAPSTVIVDSRNTGG